MANPSYPDAYKSPGHIETVLRGAAAADISNNWNIWPNGLYLMESKQKAHLKGTPVARNQVALDLERSLLIDDDLQISGGNFLVFDDVCTTGSQLNAIARRLKAEGAARVAGLVLARKF